MDIEVVRSPRRKKTVQATMVGSTLRVAIPAAMSEAEELHWVEEMRRRFARRRATAEIDLPSRAARLADEFDLPSPSTIVWSDRQRMRWGSCTPAERRIRISNRLAGFPSWVIDYVIVHELAHLVLADHSPQFWSLVGRYALAERARGYLIARSGTDEEVD